MRSPSTVRTAATRAWPSTWPPNTRCHECCGLRPLKRLSSSLSRSRMARRLSIAPGEAGLREAGSVGGIVRLVVRDFRPELLGKGGRDMSSVKPPQAAEGEAVHRKAEPYDVLIVGGGAIGPILACALADALGVSARIGLVDPAAPDAAPGSADARASAISAGSKRLLDVLGIWRLVAPHAEPVAAVDITDASLDDLFRP